MIVAIKHEKRRFVEKVDFVTSPGYLDGDSSRHDSGLISGGMYRVVTDLAILGFDEKSKNMKVEALHPGVSAEEVRDNTGFDLLIEEDLKFSDAPSDEELGVLRHLDPERLYIA